MPNYQEDRLEAFILKNIDNLISDVRKLCIASTKAATQLDMLLDLFEKYTKKLEDLIAEHNLECKAVQKRFNDLKDFVMNTKKDVVVEHDIDVKNIDKKIEKLGDSILNLERVMAQRFSDIDSKISKIKKEMIRESSGETTLSGKAKNFGSSLLEKAIPVGILYALLRFIENNVNTVFEFVSNAN